MKRFFLAAAELAALLIVAGVMLAIVSGLVAYLLPV